MVWTTAEELSSSIAAQRAWLEETTIEPIGLSLDGETFCHTDPVDTAEFLIELKRMGYYVPQYAIEILLEEAATSDPVPDLACTVSSTLDRALT